MAPVVTPKQTVIPYRPIGSAREVFTARDRVLVVGGPVRTGKSRACLEYVHLCCLRYPGLRALFVRQTMSSMRDTALQTFEDDVLGETSIASVIIGSADRGNRMVYQYPNGSRINLVGMADINRVLSAEFDIIYIQQLEECEFDDVQKLRTRLTGKVLPYPSRMICDCNPGPPTHWIVQKSKEGWLRLIDSRFEENPRWFDHDLGVWTEPGKLLMDDLDRLEGYVKDRMRYGKWVAAEGARWPFIQAYEHQFKMGDRFPYGLPEGYRKVMGVDFGTAAPYACLWLAIDEDKNVFVYREDYQAGIGSAEQAQRMVAKTGNEYISGIYPDPTVFNKPQDPHRDPQSVANLKTVADYYREAFAPDDRFGSVVQIAADPKRRKIGMDLITTLLTRNNGYPDLWIEEGCKALWKELCEAVWHQPASGVHQEDIDPKCADHAITALYYPLIVFYAGAVAEKRDLPTTEEVQAARSKDIYEQSVRAFNQRTSRPRSRRI